ncbi:helix-turn-helix transcriptional regulator [Haloferax sp. S1W]|uniref:helix-turn-helix transcriptional regulator n=1 Tax=Haloferax sp. S1W TaxID=3377110 RepID=UPI0037C57A14
MTEKPNGEPLSQLLVRREAFIRALAEKARDKRALAADLDTSRSTVDRVVRELVNAGLVEQRDGDYRVTLTGRCALEVFDRYERATHGVEGARDLLAMLPPDAPLDPVFLTGARVYTSSPDIPDSVLQQMFASIENADRVSGIAPVALAGQLRPYYDAATAGGTAVEMIIDTELLDRLLRSPDSRVVIAEQLEKETVDIYRTTVPFGFGLWVTESEAGIVIYTNTGVGGIARNDNDAAVSWATDVCESLREEADRVTLSTLGESLSDDTE